MSVARIRLRSSRYTVSIASGVKGHDGADFEDGVVPGVEAADALGDGGGFIDVVDVDDVEAAELLFGFGVGAVGSDTLSLIEADGGGGEAGLEGVTGDHLAFFPEVLREVDVALKERSLFFLAGGGVGGLGLRR